MKYKIFTMLMHYLIPMQYYFHKFVNIKFMKKEVLRKKQNRND